MSDSESEDEEIKSSPTVSIVNTILYLYYFFIDYYINY